MNIRVASWRRRWQTIAFVPDLGQGHVSWFGRTAGCVGWGIKVAATWYAIWSDGRTLVFQAGSKVVIVGSDSAADWRRNDDGTCNLVISERAEPVVHISYLAPQRAYDPTFDEADLEREDFFFYVSRVWHDSSWRAQLIKVWGQGFDPREASCAPANRSR